jgi:ubiquinone/menaquinone biosynthesis C-methylase UbiE
MDIQKSNDPIEYIEFERDGWGAHIEGYNDTFGAVTRQTAQATLDAAKVGGGARLLDICCGPGMLSAAAINRGTRAVGLDFPGVVALARKLVPGAEFQEGDATELPFPDNSFDAVVCGYGIMHVPDPEKAMQEMLRVLRPGGRAAVSVWDNETPLSGLGLVYKAMHDYANLNVPLPHGPNIFQFSTIENMRNALSGIGFARVEATQFAQDWQLKSGRQLLDAVHAGTVRTRALLAAQTNEVISKIIRRSAACAQATAASMCRCRRSSAAARNPSRCDPKVL